MWWLLPSAAGAAPTVRNVPADGTFAEVLNASADFDIIEIDPILISAGIPAQIDKRVTVRGGGAGLTTLQVPDGAPGVHAMLVLVDATFEDLTIDGGGVAPLLLVTNTADLTLTRVTLQNGVDTAARGGAVDLLSGTLTATDTSFLENGAHEGGAVRQWVSTAFTCERCTFEGNDALNPVGDGGAIWVYFASLTLVDSVFLGNTSPSWHGGALSVHASTVEIDGGSFSANTAGLVGGAIALRTTPSALDIGPSKLGPTTFTGNTAQSGGAVGCEGGVCTALVSGAVFDGNSAATAGGHLYVPSGDFTLTDTTLQSGVAGTDGGGIAIVAGGLTVVRGLLCDNVAGGAGGGIWAAAPLDLRNVSALRNRAGTAGGAVIASAGDVAYTTAVGNLAADGGAFASTVSYALTGTVLVDHLTSPFAVDGPGAVLVAEGATWNNTGDYGLGVVSVTSSLALGGSPFDLDPTACATPIPAWQGELVDQGTGLDRDQSPSDLGATGGPDADPALWADLDVDGVVAMWDCDDLDPDVGYTPGCVPDVLPGDTGDTGITTDGTPPPGTGGTTPAGGTEGRPLGDRGAAAGATGDPVGCGCQGPAGAPSGLLALAVLTASRRRPRRRS